MSRDSKLQGNKLQQYTHTHTHTAELMKGVCEDTWGFHLIIHLHFTWKDHRGKISLIKTDSDQTFFYLWHLLFTSFIIIRIISSFLVFFFSVDQYATWPKLYGHPYTFRLSTASDSRPVSVSTWLPLPCTKPGRETVLRKKEQEASSQSKQKFWRRKNIVFLPEHSV